MARTRPPHRARCAAALLALALVLLSPAAAAAAEAAPPSVSVTIRGGVSLGAHEAGLTYYALLGLRDASRAWLRIATGASAGSLNALLAVLGACGGLPDAPEASLFWSTWIPTGFDQLAAPGSASALGAFSRDWLLGGARRIEAAWDAGLPDTCDVVLGIAATRTEPRPARMAGGLLELPTMEEKFAVRIQGRGPGRPPRATNYAGAGPEPERLLATDAAGEVSFAAIRDLVLASMSFPVAFTPMPLATCDARRVAVPGACPAAEASVSRYVDGGIFDNAPIRLAVAVARTGLEPGPAGGLVWRPGRVAGRPAVPGNLLFAFLDPEATEYPSVAERSAATEPALTAALQDLAAGFIDAARAKELTMLVEEDPEIADRVLLPRRHFPAASAPLFAFLGFFETEFRIFDFTLGMYDGRRALEPRADGAPVRVPADAWPRLACMRAVYDALPGAAQACGGDGLGDFRALLQVSLDQLYERCRRRGAGAGEGAFRNPHCARAARGEAPPRVPGLAPARWPERSQAKDETDLSWSMRLLGAYGFRFADLGVPQGRGDLALDRIRHRLGHAGDAVARAQPRSDRTQVALAVKVAADTLSYAPPARLVHLATGPTATELGLSVGTAEATWVPRTLRGVAAVGFRGLADMLSADLHPAIAFSLTVGSEVQPPLPSVLAQLKLGARAGWLFAREDAYGQGRCLDGGRTRVSACSRPVVQAVVSTSLLEMLRVQLVGEWYPATATRSELWSVAPGIGFEWGF